MSALDVNCFLNIGKSGEEVRPLVLNVPKPLCPAAAVGHASQEIHTGLCHVSWQGLL